MTQYYIQECRQHNNFYKRADHHRWYRLTSFSGERRNYWQPVDFEWPTFIYWTQWRKVDRLTMLLLMGQEP